MTTDDQITSTPSGTKRIISHKHRVKTVGNNGLSRLPSLLSKSSSFISQSGRLFLLFFLYNLNLSNRNNVL
jgi:hypothetical protein